ncbi:MAG TPA: hypothetical protein VMU12_01000 [Candidatus Paceibacterota bacterium]|nr:hypothetical protein [Candidatus Paceibacterota bacterium]
MDNIFWAGLGFDRDQAGSFEISWWWKAEDGLARVLAGGKLRKLGDPVILPRGGPAFFQFQQYAADGVMPTIVNIEQLIGEQPFRVGFGLLALTEREATEQLEYARRFLKSLDIPHPPAAVGVWTCGAPRVSYLRRKL